MPFFLLGNWHKNSTFPISGIRLRVVAPAAPVAPVAPSDFLFPQGSSDLSSKFDFSGHTVNSFSAFSNLPNTHNKTDAQKEVEVGVGQI